MSYLKTYAPSSPLPLSLSLSIPPSLRPSLPLSVLPSVRPFVRPSVPTSPPSPLLYMSHPSLPSFPYRWVYDQSYFPQYSAKTCMSLRDEFACQRNGRTDWKFLKYVWRSPGCNIQRSVGRPAAEDIGHVHVHCCLE